MRQSRTWQLLGGGLIGLMLSLSGCGEADDRPLVSGSVTLDGDPVPEGEVMLVPTDMAVATDAGPIQNGRYRVRTTPGAKRVMIYWERDHPTDKIPGPDPGVMVPRAQQLIPARYNDATELEVQVQPGANTFDFALESE